MVEGKVQGVRCIRGKRKTWSYQSYRWFKISVRNHTRAQMAFIAIQWTLFIEQRPRCFLSSCIIFSSVKSLITTIRAQFFFPVKLFLLLTVCLFILFHLLIIYFFLLFFPTLLIFNVISFNFQCHFSSFVLYLFLKDSARACRAMTWYRVRNILARLCFAPDDSQPLGALVPMNPPFVYPAGWLSSHFHVTLRAFNLLSA